MSSTSPSVILLVEDNPADEALALRALKRSHATHTVVTKRDGAEAVDWLHGSSVALGSGDSVPLVEHCRLVLLDLKLPKLGGFEVLQRIRAHERTRLLPVVIFSSSKEDEDVEQGYRFGANSFVCKPIDSQLFTAAIKSLGDFWLETNVAPPCRSAG